MNIGVDVDNTIAHTHKVIIPYFQKHYNAPHDPKNMYFNDESLNLPKGTVTNELKKMVKEKAFADLEPIETASAFLTYLAKDHKLFYITSRADIYDTIFAAEEELKGWLKQYSFPQGTIYIVDGKYEKIEIAKNIELDVMIDDLEQNLTLFVNEGIKSLLFDQPWNKECFNEKIIRCLNWNEVLSNISLL